MLLAKNVFVSAPRKKEKTPPPNFTRHPSSRPRDQNRLEKIASVLERAAQIRRRLRRTNVFEEILPAVGPTRSVVPRPNTRTTGKPALFKTAASNFSLGIQNLKDFRVRAARQLSRPNRAFSTRSNWKIHSISLPGPDSRRLQGARQGAVLGDATPYALRVWANQPTAPALPRFRFARPHPLTTKNSVQSTFVMIY